MQHRHTSARLLQWLPFIHSQALRNERTELTALAARTQRAARTESTHPKECSGRTDEIMKNI